MAQITSKITLQVAIKNNKFASNLPMIKSILDAHNDTTIDVTFARRRNKASNPQRRYYFGVIVPIIQDCIKNEWGDVLSIEETHNFIKANCNFIEVVNEDTGEVLRRTKSITENDTVGQEMMHDKARKLAHDFFNTIIPLPNEGMDLDLDFNK